MSSKHEWIGSSDPAKLSGVGVFQVGVHHVARVPFSSFKDFHAVSQLLSAAERVGAEGMRLRLKASIDHLLEGARP